MEATIFYTNLFRIVLPGTWYGDTPGRGAWLVTSDDAVYDIENRANSVRLFWKGMEEGRQYYLPSQLAIRCIGHNIPATVLGKQVTVDRYAVEEYSYSTVVDFVDGQIVRSASITKRFTLSNPVEIRLLCSRSFALPPLPSHSSILQFGRG